MHLLQLLRAPEPDVDAIRDHLDALSSSRRVAEVLELGAKSQAKLFDLAKGFLPMSLDDLVPPGTAPMHGVPHEGRNSLPTFTRFAKVFYQPDDEALLGKEVWGYNRTSRLVTTTVGPGYYVAYPHGHGELLVDYTRHPPRTPKGGPRFLPNDARLSRFVYNKTQDVLRGVSKHVSIGRAARSGKTLDNWFVLCRVG
ncbi:MAG: hypothetical protein IT380_05175 [Myxococcales bacterium]|nr:hypothetical protein [Myxococcales bacterium]